VFKDYLYEFYTSSLGFYIGVFVFLFVSILSRPEDFGGFWQIVGLIGVAAIEACLMTQETDVTQWLFPNRTIHERISLLQQAYTGISITIAQLGPLYFVNDESSSRKEALLKEIEAASQSILLESQHLVKSELIPFAKHPEMTRQLEKLTIKTMAEQNYFKEKDQFLSTLHHMEKKLN
jgi:hypothetical protein